MKHFCDYLLSRRSLSSLLARLTLSFTLEILLWSTGKTGKVSTPPLARL